MARKTKQVIELEDAMNNLATIAAIDLEAPPSLGVFKQSRFVTDEEELGANIQIWLDSEGEDPILEVLDLTYNSIYAYLYKLYEDTETDWEKEKTQRGIASMMTLVGESADRMESFLMLHLGKKVAGSVKERNSFERLQKFYSNKFVLKFSEGIEGSKAWSKQWEEGEDEIFLDVTRTGLKDFETIMRDQEYELFYIRKENGEPYFNSEMLQNIKLSCDFDLDDESFEEDPLLKVRSMQDRDFQASARQILKECEPWTETYYKKAKSLEGNTLGESIGMALSALFLSANPKNLLQNTMGKSSFQYFIDFHKFLRRALKTAEYQKLVAYPPDKTDKISWMLLNLVHALAFSFFNEKGGVKLESIGLIHKTMRRGEEEEKKGGIKLLKGEGFWNQISLDDEKIRVLLAKFPNGPIFKVLDLIREEGEEGLSIPFDPIGQENLPMHLFQIKKGDKKIDVLRIPSPTRQWMIGKVEIVDEFLAYLRFLEKGEVHLLINLQDRSSWKEHARSKALESLQMKAEFSSHLVVLTLPKYSDFYHQINEYLNFSSKDAFLETFLNLMKTPESWGMFLPLKIHKPELTHFCEILASEIASIFFDEKKTFSRQNREDFIEIFYQFFILKCIEMVGPSSLSFTCKDAVDVGASASGAFYAFLKLLHSDFSNKQDQDFFRWLVYTAALFIRERVVHPDRVNRIFSMLERVDRFLSKDKEGRLKKIKDLFRKEIWDMQV